jgi:hypothetical protein
MSAILGSSGPLIVWQVMAALLLTSDNPFPRTSLLVLLQKWASSQI